MVNTKRLPIITALQHPRYLRRILPIVAALAIALCPARRGGAQSFDGQSSKGQVSHWLEQLRTPDTRLDVAYDLDERVFGRRSTETMLRQSLTSPNVLVRRTVASALGDVRKPSRKTLRSLLSLLSDPAPEVRAGATISLARLGAPAVPWLVRSLAVRTRVGTVESIPVSASDYAAVALIYTRAPVFVPLARLYDRLTRASRADHNRHNSFDTAELIEAVVRQRHFEDPKAIGVFLKSRDDTLRELAVDALSAIGPRAQAAIPAIVKLLHSDDDPYFKVMCLKAMGPVAADSLLGLLASSASDEVREAAVEALGSIVLSLVPDREVVKPGLRRSTFLMADPYTGDSLTEYERRELFRRIGHGLSTALADEDQETRLRAAHFLSQVDPFDADWCGPLFADLSAGGDLDTTIELFAGIPQCQAVAGSSDKSVAALVQALKAEDAETRRRAAKIISVSNIKVASAEPALVAALSREADTTISESTEDFVRALGVVSTGGQSTMDIIERLMEHESVTTAAVQAILQIPGGKSRLRTYFSNPAAPPLVRQAACEALRSDDLKGIGNEYLESDVLILTLLTQRCSGGKPDLPEERHEVLARLARHGRRLVGPVLDIYNHGSTDDRIDFIRLLATAAPEDRRVVDFVRTCLTDYDSEVRKEAVAALGKLGLQEEELVSLLVSVV